MGISEWEFETGLVRSQAYCAGAEHCEWEVRNLLERHGLSADDRDRILERLKAQAFVDDSRYARSFVSDKLRFDHWGRRKIIMALKLKHVESDVIAAAIEGIDMEVYMEVLEKLTLDCFRRTKAADERTRNVKTVRSMAAKGFEPSLVARILNDCEIVDND